MIEKLVKDGVGFVDENGVYHESEKAYLQQNILGFCGCGNPDEVMLYVETMLEKLDNEEWGDYEDMPYMFFVYWANENDFVEHGISARCSWLTDKGRDLLADIKKVK